MGEPEGDSGGTAHGLNAFIENTDRSTLSSLGNAMTEVGEWIEAAAGYLLGHVKVAVTTEKGTVTLNLTDLDTGVEYHGELPDGIYADIRFMAAVLDVEHGELAERMKRALISNGFKLKNKNIIDLR
jgi:hypothetical protein